MPQLMAILRTCLVVGAALVLLVPGARGQAVGFLPVVGAIPNGPTLGVTPAVSIDRRYVRLGINAQFIGNVGFNTYLVPGAVGGGPGGPGALGGAGLGAVGGGGGGGGGGQFLAGMNGVIPQGGGLRGEGFPGNPAVDFSQPAYVAFPVGPDLSRDAGQRARKTSKTLKRGKTNLAKPSATRAASAPRSKEHR